MPSLDVSNTLKTAVICDNTPFHRLVKPRLLQLHPSVCGFKTKRVTDLKWDHEQLSKDFKTQMFQGKNLLLVTGGLKVKVNKRVRAPTAHEIRDNNLVTGRTFFLNTNIHKLTWMCPDGATSNYNTGKGRGPFKMEETWNWTETDQPTGTGGK